MAHTLVHHSIKYVVLLLLLFAIAFSWTKSYCAFSGSYSLGEPGPYYPWAGMVAGIGEHTSSRCSAARLLGDNNWFVKFAAERRFATIVSEGPALDKIVSCKGFEYPAATDPLAGLEAFAREFSACMTLEQSAPGKITVRAKRENLTPTGQWLMCGCTKEQVDAYANRQQR